MGSRKKHVRPARGAGRSPTVRDGSPVSEGSAGGGPRFSEGALDSAW